MPCFYKTAGLFRGGFISILFLLSGCSHLQSTQLIQTGHPFTKPVELSNVPFFAQQEFQCGPASLAMMLQHQNIHTSVDTLISQVYLPDKKGSLQIELLAATRRNNLIPYILEPRLEHMLTEIKSGHAVLVLQNLGLGWLPSWHFAVVIGYDLTNRQLILRSGTQARHVVSMKVFERTWARANYWAAVILPANKLPATAEELKYVQAVSNLERIKKFTISNTAYQSALQQWPGSYAARMGYGNSFYALQNYPLAKQQFTLATQLEPQSADAFNNLADTLLKLQQYEAATRAAKRAIEIGGVHTEVYRQTLHEISKNRL